MFLVHGGADPISDPENSVVLYRELKRASVPADLHIFATATHDFGVRRSDRPCSSWTDSCAEWMRHQSSLKPDTRP
jgi:dipeptidyl aminopeptidase/acylaminoacyl peptidase